MRQKRAVQTGSAAARGEAARVRCWVAVVRGGCFRDAKRGEGEVMFAGWEVFAEREMVKNVVL